MDMTLVDKALHLDPREKIILIEALTKSLDEPDPDIEKAWVAESQARYESYKAGTSKAIPASAVFERLRK